MKVREARGWVYILKSEGLYKIGRTLNPKQRIKSYRTQNPYGTEVVIMERVEEYLRTEAAMLRMFEGKKVKGEWFRLTRHDIEELKKIMYVFQIPTL